MIVRVCKTIDVDAEVNVDIEDVLAEFSQRIDEADGDNHRFILPTLDWMTKIMASVKDETIANFPQEARAILCGRLTAQAVRYDDMQVPYRD